MFVFGVRMHVRAYVGIKARCVLGGGWSLWLMGVRPTAPHWRPTPTAASGLCSPWVQRFISRKTVDRVARELRDQTRSASRASSSGGSFTSAASGPAAAAASTASRGSGGATFTIVLKH